MSEKVKVTVKQKEAIDRLNEYQLEQIKDFKKNPEKYADWVSPLNELPEKKIIDALYIGYEVEPALKKGDWAVHNSGNGTTRLITEVKSGHIIVSDGEDEFIWGTPYVRRATPEEIEEEKERRWWKELNRKIKEYRVGDLAKKNGSTKIREINYIEGDGSVGFAGSLHLYVPDEVKLICPAEKRLDASE